MGGLWGLFSVEVPKGNPPAPATFPSPQLEADPAAELKRVEADQTGRLAGYRWVDRDKRIVAIPIDRAMAIEAARGADAFAPIDTLEQGAKTNGGGP